MESKRLRMARALDEFERTIDEQVGLPLRKNARMTTSMQNVLAVNIRKGIEEYAEEYDLDVDMLFDEGMLLLDDRLSKAVCGLCDEFSINPLIENGKEVGKKLTYYKYGRRIA